MRVAVIGTGYVGLVQGACLADIGHQVVCADVSAERIAKLGKGEMPIYEPGLRELVAKNVELGRLQFSESTACAVAGAQVIFLAVGTPSLDCGGADLSQLEAAADEVAMAIDRFVTIAIKSTVPVGTSARIEARIAQCTRAPFAMAFNPEFLREGRAIADCSRPDRVVIGTDDARASAVLCGLYEPMVSRSGDIQTMDVTSAELCKYAANTMLATRLALVNELAELAEKVGADIGAVAQAMGADHRIGPHFLEAGPGFGGSCFPKDLRALRATGSEHALEMDVVDAAIRSNERQKHRTADNVAQLFGGTIEGKRISIWGLAFKSGTDDVRDSAALTLARDLHGRGAHVVCADPIAAATARVELPDEIRISDSHRAISRGADAIVVMTEWPQFAATHFGSLIASVRNPVILDARRVLPAAIVRQAGFRLVQLGVGRQRAAWAEAAVA